MICASVTPRTSFPTLPTICVIAGALGAVADMDMGRGGGGGGGGGSGGGVGATAAGELAATGSVVVGSLAGDSDGFAGGRAPPAPVDAALQVLARLASLLWTLLVLMALVVLLQGAAGV